MGFVPLTSLRCNGIKNGNLIHINNRAYKLIDGKNPHLVPVLGKGIHELDRGEFKVLQKLNESGDTTETRDQLLKDRINIDTLNRTLDLYRRVFSK